MTNATVIRDGTGSTATILTGVGFNCFSFAPDLGSQPVEVLWAEPGFGPESDPVLGGIPILFPFAGRLRGTSFTWQGTAYRVPGANSSDGNAIHGFVLNRPWRVVDHAGDRVTGAFQASVDDPALLDQWPADFRIAITYQVSGHSLTGEFEITNPDTRPLPFGFGTHPYFRVPVGQGDAVACRITVPASEYWERAGIHPTGRILPVTPDQDLRHGPAFGGIAPEGILTGLAASGGTVETSIEDPESGLRVVQTFDDRIRHCIVFTPPHRNGIAIEPWLAVPDLFTLEAQGVASGLTVLAPGDTFSARIAIRLEQAAITSGARRSNRD
jgi:aldose 1-epimerase